MYMVCDRRGHLSFSPVQCNVTGSHRERVTSEMFISKQPSMQHSTNNLSLLIVSIVKLAFFSGFKPVRAVPAVMIFGVC